jgi:diaminopimelate decarboxylase
MPNYSVPDSVFIRAAEQFPTPFHLYDEAGIRNTIRALQDAFEWEPGFMEYFAVKALPNPHILNLFKEEGCGLDCSSLCELMLAGRVNVTGKRVMFSANAMPPSEFTYAQSLGAIINLDDISHIDLLPGHGGVPEEICVRYNPGAEFRIKNSIMGTPGESKYGWTREQLPVGIKKLRSMGVKRFGLHAFLASNVTDDEYYPELARILFETGSAVSEETGVPLSFINLSGGIGIPYRPEERLVDIKRVGAGVKGAYHAVFGAPENAGVRLKAELGRYMTGPHGWLITRAVHYKDISKRYIGVDACAAHLLRPAMYGAYHHITVCGKRGAPLTETYDIVGSLCENNDKFAIDRRMPPIAMGDLLAIHDAGAHGQSMGYQYNGRLRCAEVLLRADGSFKLIRRAETPEDYFATIEPMGA